MGETGSDGTEEVSQGRSRLWLVLFILGFTAFFGVILWTQCEKEWAEKYPYRSTLEERNAFIEELTRELQSYRHPDGWIAGIDVDLSEWKVTDYGSEYSVNDVLVVRVHMTDEYRKATPGLQCGVFDKVDSDLTAMIDEAYDSTPYGAWVHACLKDYRKCRFEKKPVSIHKNARVTGNYGYISYDIVGPWDSFLNKTNQTLFVVSTPSRDGVYRTKKYVIRRSSGDGTQDPEAYEMPQPSTKAQQTKPAYGPHEYSSGDDPFDPYNAKDYDNADDFADDWPYEFSDDEEEDYELAIEYWEEHH